MQSPDQRFNPEPRLLRQFAAGWLVFFLGTGAYQYFWHDRQQLGLGLAAAALVGAGLWWAKPALFRWLYVAWMLLAFPIGWISSQLALALMFFLVITPVALVLKLGRRDRLRRTKPEPAATYWIDRKMPSDVRSYFRPY